MSDIQQQIGDLPLSEDLLRYYKTRVERSEQDYQDALSRIDSVRLAHEEHHRLTWELQQRMGDVAELQHAMSELQVCVVRDRKQLLQVIAENDELKVQELRDRRKVQYLLKITGSADAEPTDDKHEAGAGVGPGGRVGKGKGGGRPDRRLGAEAPDDISLPMPYEVETLRLTVTALRAQVSDQKQAYEEMIAHQERDREARLLEEEARQEADAERIRELTTKVQKLEVFCRENTKELLQVKKASLAQERAWQEERARVLTELGGIKASADEERTRNDMVERSVEIRLTKKYELTLSELKRRNREMEEELRTVKANRDVADASHKTRVESLQRKVESATTNYAALRKRRNLDLEGFTHDIAGIRRQLKSLERQVLKYAPVDDHELNLLVLARETGEQVNKIADELQDMKSRLYETEREVRQVVI